MGGLRLAKQCVEKASADKAECNKHHSNKDECEKNGKCKYIEEADDDAPTSGKPMTASTNNVVKTDETFKPDTAKPNPSKCHQSKCRSVKANMDAFAVKLKATYTKEAAQALSKDAGTKD